LTKRWISSITSLSSRPPVRLAALTVYYLAVLVALIVMYGKGDFSAASFVYQGF
jgi:hypothetical protein